MSGSYIKNGYRYEDAELPNALALVKWVNAQVARHQDGWRLTGIDTSTTAEGLTWCGLIFEEVKLKTA